MPPYLALYRGGLPPSRMRGKYFRASSSQVVMCARMSLTDHFPVTPGSNNCDSGRPVYDSLKTAHASLSRCSTCSLFMPQPDNTLCITVRCITRGVSRLLKTTILFMNPGTIFD